VLWLPRLQIIFFTLFEKGVRLSTAEISINDLIYCAIDASVEFEKLMDSIDFNSYLPEKKEIDNVKKSERYRKYCDNFKITKGICQKVIDDIEKFMLSSSKIENKELYCHLISHLFKAKKFRLEGRSKITPEEEKQNYINAIHTLQKSFYEISETNFYRNQKKKNLEDDFNWVKVLFYNELAICYSGLVDSSISLGYAERSLDLLKELFPKIESQNIRIVKLYTFALYNKGEAERLLGNKDLALKTFKKIIESYKDIDEKPSDFISALLRISLILIDQGRGSEAITFLTDPAFDKIENSFDCRLQERDLEKANALIDQKVFIDKKGAWDILTPYFRDDWNNTFYQRKAKNAQLRLMIEFKKNRLENFEKSFVKADYDNFENIATSLLKESVKRYDPDSFKKACTNLADYFHEKKEKKEKNVESELRYYYLYLFNELIFKQNDKCEEIVNEWITPKELKDLLSKHFSADCRDSLNEIDDERYLIGFFETYIDYDKCLFEGEEEIITKLKDRLIEMYLERDNLFGVGEVGDKYSNRKRSIGEKIDSKDPIDFVKHSFFEGKPYNPNKDVTFLSPGSILNKMHHNTKKFANKVVGQSKISLSDQSFNGVMTVLRRWNSFTPMLASSVNPSKGGGYFFYFWHTKNPLGIVVDPGYDFLENFFSQGFRIGDINTIIISHAHPDHTDNFLSILSLYHELNDRLGEYYRKCHSKRPESQQSLNKKHLKLIISQGVFDQYSKLIQPSKESLEDIVVVQASRSADEPIPCYEHKFDDTISLKINAFATSHKDLSSESESLGFIIEINNREKENRQIGYTSDARWSPDFTKRFHDCQIVCAHLGSIVDIFKEEGFCILCSRCDDKECEECIKCKNEGFMRGNPNEEKLRNQAIKQSHLYLSGLAMFSDDLLKNGKIELLVISEFGEELKGGIRMDLYHKFDDWYQKRSDGKSRCIPGDIGVEVDLMNSNIFCSCCENYKRRDKISPIAYGKEEAIFFVCDECKSVLSTHQIDEKLKEHYENGRKLELADVS